MKIRLQLTDNPPTVTSQEKGETIKYKWIVRNGKRVSIPYIHHFEKPEVTRARSFYTGKILIEMKKNKLLQDVLADIGFFKVGDQQIGDLRVIKVWSEEPFIEIEIQEATEVLNDIIGGVK